MRIQTFSAAIGAGAVLALAAVIPAAEAKEVDASHHSTGAMSAQTLSALTRRGGTRRRRATNSWGTGPDGSGPEGPRLVLRGEVLRVAGAGEALRASPGRASRLRADVLLTRTRAPGLERGRVVRRPKAREHREVTHVGRQQVGLEKECGSGDQVVRVVDSAVRSAVLARQLPGRASDVLTDRDPETAEKNCSSAGSSSSRTPATSSNRTTSLAARVSSFSTSPLRRSTAAWSPRRWSTATVVSRSFTRARGGSGARRDRREPSPRIRCR